LNTDAGLAILVGSEGAVGRAGDRLAYIANPDRAAIAVREDGFVERRRVDDLVVRGDGEARSLGIDGTLRRNSGRTDERLAHFLQRQATGGELGRVDLDADRGMLFAEDDLGNAGPWEICCAMKLSA
jgi:hypothetical protein